MIKIWGRPTAFNVQKVLWMLEELHLDYEHILVGGKYGGLETPEFLQKNPGRKIPVVNDEEGFVYESHTILRYLAAKYSYGNLWRESPYERTLVERWMDWSHISFQPAFMEIFWGYYRQPEEKRNISVIDNTLSKCFVHLNLLNSQLKKQSYLSGDQFSIADITCGAVLYRLCEMGLEVKLPTHTKKWYQLLQKRKGYQKWIMSDFSELKGRETF